MRLVALAVLIFGEAPWGAVGPLARPFYVLSHRSPAVMSVLALTYPSHRLPNVLPVFCLLQVMSLVAFCLMSYQCSLPYPLLPSS